MRRLIILAAGQGTRLRPLTDDRPKCMVQLAGRPLIEWQVAAARAAGVDEIVIVRGYRSQALVIDGAEHIDNARFESTNMVYSLWCARERFGAGCVVSYGDIVYEPAVLEAMYASPAPTAVAVDRDWLAYWKLRSADPLADAESMRLTRDGRITSIGQRPSTLEEIEGQYIGLSAYDETGVAALVHALQVEAAAFEHGTSVAHPTRDFAKLYMTDLLQSMANSAQGVHAVPIHGKWLEVDTPADLALAESLVRIDGRILRIDR